MKLYPRNYDILETSEEVGKALLGLIKENLDLERWDFQLSFTKFQKTSNIKIIYDSKWCRIKFMFSRQRFARTLTGCRWTMGDYMHTMRNRS